MRACVTLPEKVPGKRRRLRIVPQTSSHDNFTNVISRIWHLLMIRLNLIGRIFGRPCSRNASKHCLTADLQSSVERAAEALRSPSSVLNP